MPPSTPPPTVEDARLAEDAARLKNWKRWGPYLAERQWGTVREDYSADGDCWAYLSHDHSRSRAYRWGEDGILGICDRECRLCFAIALWNGKDPILKERLFGLTGPEGNHGEDVKEEYFYLDSMPTHSYFKGLYKYPMAEFPYAALIEESRRRSRDQPEFELVDTGVFDHGHWDVVAEYAKSSPNDVLIRITVTNHGKQPATLHVLPTFWFRNTWSWGCNHEGCTLKPRLKAGDSPGAVDGDHQTLGRFACSFDLTARDSAGKPIAATAPLLFTDNESNNERLFGSENATPHVKDAFHDHVIRNTPGLLNPRGIGTKAAAHHKVTLGPGESATVRARLTLAEELSHEPGAGAFSRESGFDEVFSKRIAEADEFASARLLPSLTAQERNVCRQAYAGLLWSKQFYHYVVDAWLDGDPNQPPPPEGRKTGRNADWRHLFNRDVILMPDKWEYPWYASWDLAFHCVALARTDPHFAKEQLVLFLREWYMHPSGQIPAYEFALGDVNPPVHAWACWRVYKMTGRKGVPPEQGGRDRAFLARCFHKLLINFTWWVNRKDPDGRNIFGGGFLGLDNIGVFDRSRPLPGGGRLEQADGTAWMAFYCGQMLVIAMELAAHDPAYEDVASKFFEHFIAITDAMNRLGGTGLWHEQDGFYYDQLHVHDESHALRVRSLVGLIPLLAAGVLEDSRIDRLPGFKRRMEWFLRNRKDLSSHISYMQHDAHDDPAQQGHRLLAIPSRERLTRVLRYVLDEEEFLSPFGIRSLSKVHEREPYVIHIGGQEFRVDYAPGESTSSLFGGNSNWRGPIWFPVNYLIIEALERYHHFYGDSLKVELPTGSGRSVNLGDVAHELRRRLASIFLPAGTGTGRPCHAGDPRFASDPCWRDLLLFHEYFHAETGAGVGASHQTGWTALVAVIMRDLAQARVPPVPAV